MELLLFKRGRLEPGSKHLIMVNGEWGEDARGDRELITSRVVESTLAHAYAISMVPVGLCWRSYDFIGRKIMGRNK